MKKIKFNKTIKDFGDEWEKFDNNKVEKKELKKIFDSYFRVFPKKLFNKKFNKNTLNNYLELYKKLI